MKQEIRISIVTITFNAARTLQRTLDSVARQSYQHLEHLIIDGASKDDTVAIAERYKASAPYEVSIQSEPDKGLYDAMNKGLAKATGDYIVFLNAGDALHAADTLATVVSMVNSPTSSAHLDLQVEERSTFNVQRLMSNAPAVVYGDTAVTDADGHFLRLRRHRPPKVLTWKSFKKGMLVCHQAFYVRLDIAREFPYNLQYRHSADVDWCIRIMKEASHRGLALVNADAVLADFEEGGDSTQHHRDSLKERYQVMATHYGAVQTFLLHCWFVVRAVFMK